MTTLKRIASYKVSLFAVFFGALIAAVFERVFS